jgi:hypothetical protein
MWMLDDFGISAWLLHPEGRADYHRTRAAG